MSGRRFCYDGEVTVVLPFWKQFGFERSFSLFEGSLRAIRAVEVAQGWALVKGQEKSPALLCANMHPVSFTLSSLFPILTWTTLPCIQLMNCSRMLGGIVLLKSHLLLEAYALWWSTKRVEIKCQRYICLSGWDELPFSTWRTFWVFSKGSRHNAGGADAKVLWVVLGLLRYFKINAKYSEEIFIYFKFVHIRFGLLICPVFQSHHLLRKSQFSL